ncbi:hypothetical protein VTP21DRAFT_3793 [Calcarisporiella thermophila]
MNVVLKGYHTL